MAGTGDEGNPQLEGAQRLLLDVMTIQLQRIMRTSRPKSKLKLQVKNLCKYWEVL